MLKALNWGVRIPLEREGSCGVKVASRACAADRRQPARVEAPTRAHRAGALFLTMAAGSWPGALKAPGFSVSIVVPSMRNIHRIFYRNRTRTGVGRKRQRHRQSRAVAVAHTREAKGPAGLIVPDVEHRFDSDAMVEFSHSPRRSAENIPRACDAHSFNSHHR
jgi:hypothetical protein